MTDTIVTDHGQSVINPATNAPITCALLYLPSLVRSATDLTLLEVFDFYCSNTTILALDDCDCHCDETVGKSCCSHSHFRSIANSLSQATAAPLAPPSASQPATLSASTPPPPPPFLLPPAIATAMEPKVRLLSARQESNADNLLQVTAAVLAPTERRPRTESLAAALPPAPVLPRARSSPLGLSDLRELRKTPERRERARSAPLEGLRCSLRRSLSFSSRSNLHLSIQYPFYSAVSVLSGA